MEFARGAAVLVHDTMYTSEEYDTFVGWGHSTHEDAVELAIEAEVERLVLFHHRPERTDDEVDRCLERCRALVAASGARLEVVAAAEGMTLMCRRASDHRMARCAEVSNDRNPYESRRRP